MKRIAIIVLSLSLFTLPSCKGDLTGDPIPITSIHTKYLLKAQVGHVLYEQVDGQLTVEGYSENDEPGYSETFTVTPGVENEIILPAHFHHFRFSAAAYGSTTSKTFTKSLLYEQRPDAPHPVTLEFILEIASPKLKKVTRFNLNADGDVETWIPASKKEFSWMDESLVAMRNYTFDGESEEFTLSSYYTLVHEAGAVSEIQGYDGVTDETISKTSYDYLPGGNIDSIDEQNFQSGITTTLTFDYDASNSSVMVTYSVSSNQTFTYHFNYIRQNITSDETRNGSTLCNQGSYDYDGKINPYRHLGFADINLTYLSINNKLTEDVAYIGCSFPGLTIESYEFEYNESGLPITARIHYSNGGVQEDQYEYYQ